MARRLKTKHIDKFHFYIPFQLTFYALGSCDRASRAKYEERKTNKMQQLDVYYQLLSQHVSGIIMPIF